MGVFLLNYMFVCFFKHVYAVWKELLKLMNVKQLWHLSINGKKNKKQNLEDISKPKYNLVEEKINPVSSMLQPPYTFTLCMLYVYSKKLFGCRW